MERKSESDIIFEVHKQLRVSEQHLKTVLSAFFDQIKKEILAGNNVFIRRFGSFTPRVSRGQGSSIRFGGPRRRKLVGRISFKASKQFRIALKEAWKKWKWRNMTVQKQVEEFKEKNPMHGCTNGALVTTRGCAIQQHKAVMQYRENDADPLLSHCYTCERFIAMMVTTLEEMPNEES